MFDEAARDQRALGCRHGETKREQNIGPRENCQGPRATMMELQYPTTFMSSPRVWPSKARASVTSVLNGLRLEDCTAKGTRQCVLEDHRHQPPHGYPRSADEPRSCTLCRPQLWYPIALTLKDFGTMCCSMTIGISRSVDTHSDADVPRTLTQ